MPLLDSLLHIEFPIIEMVNDKTLTNFLEQEQLNVFWLIRYEKSANFQFIRDRPYSVNSGDKITSPWW